jgi:hypothetical protein
LPELLGSLLLDNCPEPPARGNLLITRLSGNVHPLAVSGFKANDFARNLNPLIMHTADQWARVFLIDDEKVKLLKSSFPFGELYIYREQVGRLYPEVSNRVSDRLGAGILW